MANFNPPFGAGADKRFPTSDERQSGFECGPADIRLFRGLFNRLESEVGSVIDEAGITQTDDRMTLLLEAIQALIEAATGGGDPSQYLLVSQARARLPIYPEIQTTDGRITLTSPAPGTVRLPGGVSFLHRGIFVVTTAQTDFTTTASKTYHLRWTVAGGFQLKDVSNATYNPGALIESDTTFDSGYDDMLIARVITNSSNVATMTSLANKSVLTTAGEEVAAKGILGDYEIQDNTRPSLITQYTAVNINFARAPVAYLTAIDDVRTTHGLRQTGDRLDEFNVGARTLNRYQIAVWGQGDVDIWTGWAARA